jgi:hypothetical protein
VGSPGITERLLVVRRASEPDTVLVLLSGGVAQGPLCEAFAHHGCNGIEDKVVGDMSAWTREH